jgi:uncharacterized membrane protein
MAFCANCGAALTQTSGFCAGCGKPVSQGTLVAVPATATAGSAAAPEVAAASGLTSNVAAALAYVLGIITGIVFLVLEPYKNDRFVRFHAMQSILFSVAAFLIGIAWNIVVGIMVNISGFAVVLFPIGLVIWLGFFLFWLFLMYQAYSGREFHIPVIGAIAAKQLG